LDRSERTREAQRRHSRARQRALAAVAKAHQREYRAALEAAKAAEGIRKLQPREVA
jgi:hypothetical protein